MAAQPRCFLNRLPDFEERPQIPECAVGKDVDDDGRMYSSALLLPSPSILSQRFLRYALNLKNEVSIYSLLSSFLSFSFFFESFVEESSFLSVRFPAIDFHVASSMSFSEWIVVHLSANSVLIQLTFKCYVNWGWVLIQSLFHLKESENFRLLSLCHFWNRISCRF